MAVFLALVLGSIAAGIVGWLGVVYVDDWPASIAVGLAVMFVMTGVAHFAPSMRRDMIAIVPPALPAPALLVSVTGVLELLGAAGLLFPPTRVAAAVCLFLPMLAMFAANVHAARMAHPPTSMASRLDVRTAEEVVYLAAAVVVAVAGG
ncbi:MAG TPA: hypothetical protein VET27_21425 [Mycobacterium sp.]|nr:hypothetical protein [Mycobacterium sp.]